MTGHCSECRNWEQRSTTSGRCTLLSGTMAEGDFLCPPGFGCEKFIATPDPVLDRELWQVDEVDFGIRALKLFQNNGIHTLRDLTQIGARRLLLSRQCGRKTVSKIKTELAKLGIELRK